MLESVLQGKADAPSAIVDIITFVCSGAIAGGFARLDHAVHVEARVQCHVPLTVQPKEKRRRPTLAFGFHVPRPKRASRPRRGGGLAPGHAVGGLAPGHAGGGLAPGPPPGDLEELSTSGDSSGSEATSSSAYDDTESSSSVTSAASSTFADGPPDAPPAPPAPGPLPHFGVGPVAGSLCKSPKANMLSRCLWCERQGKPQSECRTPVGAWRYQWQHKRNGPPRWVHAAVCLRAFIDRCLDDDARFSELVVREISSRLPEVGEDDNVCLRRVLLDFRP
jgi:hypothetical protein